MMRMIINTAIKLRNFHIYKIKQLYLIYIYITAELTIYFIKFTKFYQVRRPISKSILVQGEIYK
jgi:hypothetical protein